MISISNNKIIIMNSGDYFKLPLFINAGSRLNPLRYILQEEDKLYLSILEPNSPFEAGVIRKIFTSEDLNSHGDVVLTLDDSDTENVLPGTYYYEIKLCIRRDNKDYISTIIPRKKFIIL